MKIHTVGGYNEVGKNMTVIEYDGEIVILDMGYDMETVVQHDEEIEGMTTTATIEAGAIPDDSQIHDKKGQVEAIVIGHGHLDHVGAVPKLAGSYDCPIIATPFTMTILRRMIEEDRKSLNNQLIEMQAGNTYDVSENITIEFVNITHSIPGTVLTVIHTPEGSVVYSLDFRLEDKPLLGDPPDYDRMREIGDGDVKAFIGDSTRVAQEARVKNERAVRDELQRSIDEAYESGGATFVTTFASHVERLNSIMEANDGRRKIAFIGRSLKEYNTSAEKKGFIDLSDVKVVSYRDETEELLQRISQERDEWLVVCTGNQGEPRAALSRIARGEYPVEIYDGDYVIFSSSVIPTPLNQANRYTLEKRLKEEGARVIKNVHVSGHAKREDNRDMLHMLEPDNVIPAHGTTDMLASYAMLAQEEGYRLNEDLFLCENGNTLEL